MEIFNMPQWFRETGPQVLKACSFLQTGLPFIMQSEDSMLLGIYCFASKIFYISRKKKSKAKTNYLQVSNEYFENELLLGKGKWTLFIYKVPYFQLK